LNFKTVAEFWRCPDEPRIPYGALRLALSKGKESSRLLRCKLFFLKVLTG